MGYLGRAGTPFWSGHLSRPGTKIGPWAGPGPSAKHEARGSPTRWHDGPNLARHDRTPAEPAPAGCGDRKYQVAAGGKIIFFYLEKKN